MKLILCKRCDDIVALHQKERTCFCGESGGSYIDDNVAYYFGENCIPLFISNKSLISVIRLNEQIKSGHYTLEQIDEKKLNSMMHFTSGIVSPFSPSFVRNEKPREDYKE